MDVALVLLIIFLAVVPILSIMDTVKGMGRDAAGHEANPVRVALRTTAQEGI